ncbi:MAG: hypothetical protein MJ078_06185, partial [Clostridia bacterium]|nr:hypothetical protein [Clostridia bacterium]
MLIADFKSLLKSGKTDGVFLFCGEEDYLKRHYLSELRQAVLTGEEDPFSHFVFEGEDVDFGTLTDTLRTPSLTGEKKLTEWYGSVLNGVKEKQLPLWEELKNTVEEYPG